MKLKNIFLILFLCCTSLCFAQDKLFEKYADMDNVTSVFISKKMFDMIPNVESWLWLLQLSHSLQSDPRRLKRDRWNG